MTYGFGKKKNIEKLKPYLYSPDFYSRKLAATSLGILTLKYRPRKLFKLNEILKNRVPSIRESVAFAYLHSSFEINIADISSILKSKDSTYGKKYGYGKFESNKYKLRALHSALDIYPHSTFFYELACILRKQNKWREAEKLLKKALKYIKEENEGNAQEIESKNLPCFDLLSKIYCENRNYKQCLYYLEKMEEINPLDRFLQMNLAKMYSFSRFRKSWKSEFCQCCSYLCDPKEANESFAQSWKNFSPNYFSHKKNLYGKGDSLLPALAYYYLKNKKIKTCIKIFQIIREIVDLRRDFFSRGVFSSLRNHPWVQKLPK